MGLVLYTTRTQSLPSEKWQSKTFFNYLNKVILDKIRNFQNFRNKSCPWKLSWTFWDNFLRSDIMCIMYGVQSHSVQSWLLYFTIDKKILSFVVNFYTWKVVFWNLTINTLLQFRDRRRLVVARTTCHRCCSTMSTATMCESAGRERWHVESRVSAKGLHSVLGQSKSMKR